MDEKSASYQKQETNLDHYKREILEDCLQNLAIVDGRPKRCNSISCCDCEFNNDGPIECHKKVMGWLKQPHIKPTYKLTKFEKDLLQCYLDTYMFKEVNTLRVMKKEGYFKGIDENETLENILANCEIKEED